MSSLPTGQDTFAEQGEIECGASFAPLLEALAPVLRRYGFEYSTDELARATAQNSQAGKPVKYTIGDQAGAHLLYKAAYDPGCGYDTPGEFRSITSRGLADAASGEHLRFEISMADYIYPPCHVNLKFDGAAREIENIRLSLAPVLARCGFRRS